MGGLPPDDQDRRLGDRRQADHGPVPGQPERRRRVRRASDVLRPACPWCGSSKSVVYRSTGSFRAGAPEDDHYRRRRACAECVDGEGNPRTWPTHENLDTERFAREVRREGLTLADLGVGGRVR